MCGINGVYDLNNKNSIEATVNMMNKLIFHRGPDEDGLFIEKNKNFSIAMGMRRLSIIDLNYGKQPVYSRDKNQVLVFNGEIYNYKILKKKLIDEGIEFYTDSDTEVIMRLYEKYGVNSFVMLDGMFGFSLYDKSLDKIFICRDFFGEKPIYYFKENEKLYWSSELKSIINCLKKVPEISNQALSLYFQLTYIPAPYTIYKDIYKLEANSYIEFDCITQSLEILPIGNIIENKYDKNMSFQKAKSITYELVNESIKSRTISDVPIGTFLSGGVDSSIVSLCLSENTSIPIDTFSIGFEKKSFDESNKSKLVAKLIGSNHHQFTLSDKDLVNDLDRIILNYDEPFADPSALPTFLLSKFTQEHVKVALTGDGGDEVFGGYNKYYMGKMNHIYTQNIPSWIHKAMLPVTNLLLKDKSDNRGLKFKLNKLINSVSYDNNFYNNIISLGFQKSELEYLIQHKILDINSLNYYIKNKPIKLKDFREIDKLISLEGGLLVKVDRASMLNSLECRAPFLNKKLWNFTNQLPDSYLIKGWNKKYLLKESFKDYFPDKFLDKSKRGFGVPVGDWLRSSFRDELLSFIEVEFLKKQDLFNIDFINRIVLDHLSSKKDNSYKVWTFFCFQKWYKNQYRD